MTSTMAVDGEGARDDDAVSFSSDVDEPGLDADIDADDIAALLDEREAAAPDEPLALATVARRNLPDDFLHLAGPEDIARAVAKLDQVRLDRCRLASFAGPGMSIETRRASFANVTALYLQRNRLTSTEGIDGTTLPKLRFLALQGNALVSIATLETLRKLALLDLSDNVPLAALDELVGSLPSSVRYLTCVGCGCASNDVEYREALVASLPELKRLDGVDVTRGERKAAMAAFGEDLDSEEEEEEGAEGADTAVRSRVIGSMGEKDVATPSMSAGDEARSREIRTMLPMLEDPTMDTARVVESLTTDVIGTMDIRADDLRSTARRLAGDDADADATMEARVRAARRRQAASMREADAMMPFDEFLGGSDGEGEGV